MFKTKLLQSLKKKAGNRLFMDVLDRIMNKNHEGLAIAFDMENGELMTLSKGMCHHEIGALLEDIVERFKEGELKEIHKETKEELEILERQAKERVKN